MTCISSLSSKKAFKDAVAFAPYATYIANPAIDDPWFMSVSNLRDRGKLAGDGIEVTNHPRRSWYARVYLKDGKIAVS